MGQTLLDFAVQFLKDNHITVRRVRDNRWSDSTPFDLGLREALFGKTPMQFGIVPPEQMQQTICHCTDPFGCLYTLLPLPEGDVLLLGPMVQDEDWELHCRQIARTMGLNEEQNRQLLDYFLRLPKICILAWYFPFVKALADHLYGERCSVRHVSHEELACDALPVRTVFPREKPVLSMEMLEDRYCLEKKLLAAVHQGDASAAQQALQSFSGVTVPPRPGESRQLSLQYRLVALNALLRKEAERAEVHPFYLDGLYNDLMSKIGSIHSARQEHQMVLSMVTQYCERVRQYSAAGYSPMVREAIYYIGGHLGDDLTLHRLADMLNVNRSYLSGLFRRETGRNLTDYVNTARVEFAANLMLYSQYSVAAASAAAGIPDTSYFSKLFKRVMGVSPTQYVKSSHPSGKMEEQK